MAVYVVHVRNLNYKTSEDEIRNFLSFESKGISSYVTVLNSTGRPAGEAFVEFDNETDAQAALAKDGQELGGRRAFLSKSDPASMQDAKNGPKLPMQNGGGRSGGGNYASGRGSGGGFGGMASMGGMNGMGGMTNGMNNLQNGSVNFATMPKWSLNPADLNAAGDNLGNTPDSTFIIFIKNMTFDTTEEQIREFLSEMPLLADGNGINKVTFVEDSRRRRNGEGFLVMDNLECAQAAMSFDGKQFNGRKFMLHRSNLMEYEKKIISNQDTLLSIHSGGLQAMGNRGKTNKPFDGTVRLWGFTYSSNEETIREFCSGLKIVPGRIVFERDEQGRAKSAAAVQFATFSDAQACLQRHKTTIDSIGRYIEVEPSSNAFYRELVLNNAKTKLAASGGANMMNGMSMMNGMGGMNGMNMMNVNVGGMNMTMNANMANMAAMSGMGSFGNMVSPGMNGSNSMNSISPQQKVGGPMPSALAQTNNIRVSTNPYSLNGTASNPNTNSQAPGKQEPSPPQPSQSSPATDTTNPYRFIVGGVDFPPGVGNSDIQRFFKPLKVLAVKLEADGSIDMAFKSHADCLLAMNKVGEELLGQKINLVLKSKPDDCLQVGSWSVSS